MKENCLKNLQTHLSLQRWNAPGKWMAIMNQDESKMHKAGDALEDLCRACKTLRGHTVIAADAQGGVLRVICDYCGSQHN
jgi:hypothetical protein